MSSDIEVDVNGEQVFLVKKRILASFSVRLSKLFDKFTSTTRNPKVVFHNFPGGAECFELISRFCYNNGSIDITPSNIFFLHCGAIFMEMNRDKDGIPSLIMQTELYLKGFHCWTWSEFVHGLKQCQDLIPIMNNSSVLQDFLNCLLGNLTLPYPTSPCTTFSSSDRSSFQFSGDISTTKSENSQIWQFEDLVFLNVDLFEMLIKTMILLHFDHSTIFSFLFCYQKSGFPLPASRPEKRKRMAIILDLLSSLNCRSISSRVLLDAFGISLSLKMIKCDRIKLENLLGSRLDEFTIDDLLVPSKREKKYAYNVSLVLRLMRVFMVERTNDRFFTHRVKKVGRLIDLFLAEVAPDPCLEPSKFVAMVMGLPDFARDSHDRVYQAIDMYLEVHYDLPLQEKMRMCSVLNLNKLSVVPLKHLAGNSKFRPFQLGLFFQQQPKSKIFGHENSSDFRAKTEKFTTNASGKLQKTTQTFEPKKSKSSYIWRNRQSLPRLCH